jgi:hypothetical protein
MSYNVVEVNMGKIVLIIGALVVVMYLIGAGINFIKGDDKRVLEDMVMAVIVSVIVWVSNIILKDV